MMPGVLNGNIGTFPTSLVSWPDDEDETQQDVEEILSKIDSLLVGFLGISDAELGKKIFSLMIK